MTSWFAVSAPDEANVPLAVYAKTPPDVPDVMPVPPLATGKVPVTPAVSETFVIVLVEPLIDLPVSVQLSAIPQSVPVVVGSVMIAEPFLMFAPVSWRVLDGVASAVAEPIKSSKIRFFIYLFLVLSCQ
jgi:hypothetical protein